MEVKIVMRPVDYWKSLFVAGCCMAVFAQSAPPQAPQAQDWEKAAGGKKAFDVASVKLDSGPFRPSNFPLLAGDDDASRQWATGFLPIIRCSRI